MVAGPEAGPELVAGYRKIHPDYTPGQILVRLMSDGTRWGSIKLAEAHIKGGGAPTFMYLFTWRSPRMPHMQASHGIDGGFYFGNTEVLGMTQGLADAKALAAKGSAAWATFARTGSPSTAALPWPPYTLERRATMILSAEPHVEDDPMQADRLLWERVMSA